MDRSWGYNPAFFFAPDHVRRRTRELGRDGLDSLFADSWGPFVDWARGWLRVGQQRLDALQSRQAPVPAIEQEARQPDDAVLAR